MQKTLHDFFKSNALPSPTGPLSKVIPATAISYANKEVMAVLKSGIDESGGYYIIIIFYYCTVLNLSITYTMIRFKLLYNY